MTNVSNDERTVAIAAVRAAARVCRVVQDDLVNDQTLQKKDRSPVTVADFASQAVVCAMLSDRLSANAIVGEEDSQQLRQPEQAALLAGVVQQVRSVRDGEVRESDVLGWIDMGGADASADRYWTLDPIDGTKGFLRREQYAVALALIESGRVVLGVLGCPNLASESGTGCLLVAQRGQGAELVGLDEGSIANRITVSDVSDMADARFCESVESAHSDQSQSVQIARHLGIDNEPVRMDSQAKYAAVGRGDASIYLRLPTRADYREKIWDHAAGTIVVEEAGGRVSDIDGRPLEFTHGRQLEANRGVVATNGRLHDSVIAAIQATSDPGAAS